MDASSLAKDLILENSRNCNMSTKNNEIEVQKQLKYKNMMAQKHFFLFVQPSRLSNLKSKRNPRRCKPILMKIPAYKNQNELMCRISSALKTFKLCENRLESGKAMQN